MKAQCWSATAPSSFRIKELHAVKSVLPNLSFSARNSFMSLTKLQVSVGSVLPIWNLSVGVEVDFGKLSHHLKKKSSLVLEAAWGLPRHVRVYQSDLVIFWSRICAFLPRYTTLLAP